MNSLNVEQTKNMFLYVGAQVINNRPLLTELDSAIGDGDHGIGMSVGFTKAIENLNKIQFSMINDVFKTIGVSMISSMGGASGIIFGTMFSGGVKDLSPTPRLDLTTLSTIFENALKAVKERGKAELGDKTMIDSFQPAVEALRGITSNDLLEGLKSAEEQAKIGAERTKEYIAKFGRAKSLGNRAVGYQDAGATSVWIILKSMREWLERN